MQIPHTQPGEWPAPIGAARFAAGVARTDHAGCVVALLGMPDDTGVRLNGGRPGAAEGPTAFRAALARLGAREPAGWDWPRVFDAGDVAVVPGNLDETHRRVTDAARAIADAGMVPVGIGGGHDLTFPLVRGANNTGTPWHGVYLDPHLDVRTEPGSGMAFRRLIEHRVADALTIHGFDPAANAREHLRWFQAHGGRVSELGPENPWPERDTFVSLDLDVIDQAHAPGVSAMNPAGWPPELAGRWAHAAGKNPRVRCFDVMELSPPNDEHGRTARLAAWLFLSFLRGFAERPR